MTKPLNRLQGSINDINSTHYSRLISVLKYQYRFATIAILLYCLLALTEQLDSQTIFIDFKAGAGATIPPKYLDWSEVLRNRRSPDVLQTLTISTTVLYRVSEKMFVGGDFLYKRAFEQLDARIGFGLPAELSATWVVPSVALAIVPIQPFRDGALVKITAGAGMLFGSIAESVRAFNGLTTYSATGAAVHAELSFGLPLSPLFTATLNTSLRMGMTGEAKTKSQVIDNELPTLSFVSFGMSIGVVFNL